MDQHTRVWFAVSYGRRGETAEGQPDFYEIAASRTGELFLFPYWEHGIVKKMRVIARRTLRNFWERHADSEQPLKAWFAETQVAHWSNPQAIKRRYKHASFVGDNRVIFNIGGNKYRLFVYVNFQFGVVYIKFIGTHAEYDRIDPETI